MDRIEGTQRWRIEPSGPVQDRLVQPNEVNLGEDEGDLSEKDPLPFSGRASARSLHE